MDIISYFTDRTFIVYLLKFGLAFCFFYFGTLAVIGLSAPEGYYSSFVAHYLNYIDWLRSSILYASRGLLSLLGYHSYVRDKYVLALDSGISIRMVYTCLGYGVMSFWGAFIIANQGSWKAKLKWILFGWLMIWCINVIRISLLLIVLTKHLSSPFGFDNHTWFNIASYILIFGLIYFYHTFQKKVKARPPEVDD